MLKEDWDVLVPGAHGHELDPAVDDPPPSKAEAVAELERLAVRKAAAVEADELEMALHLKRAMANLRRRAGLAPRL